MATYRLGELFCGPGGLALGALSAKIEDPKYRIIHQWANDFDVDTCNTYRRNICPNNPETVIQSDVRKLDLATLADIDGLAFGFPCNDFSIIGKQRGINGAYGPLYKYGINALKHFQPQWFLAENVGGLRSANNGTTLDMILHEMEDAGYEIFAHLFKFEQYGLPQARHRIFIVGTRKDLNVEFLVPSPELYEHMDNSALRAISFPPIPDDAANQEFTRQSKRVVERLKYIQPGENAFTADIPDHLKLKIKGAKFSQIYKRIDPSKPSYTVTGSGGGGTHMYHWSEHRALTNRERARLQTFPDSFIFEGSKESVRKQIGMAVPVNGARVIFEAILRSFAHIPYASVRPNMFIKPIQNDFATVCKP